MASTPTYRLTIPNGIRSDADAVNAFQLRWRLAVTVWLAFADSGIRHEAFKETLQVIVAISSRADRHTGLVYASRAYLEHIVLPPDVHLSGILDGLERHGWLTTLASVGPVYLRPVQ